MDPIPKLCMSSAVVAPGMFGEDLVPACYEDLGSPIWWCSPAPTPPWTIPCCFAACSRPEGRGAPAQAGGAGSPPHHDGGARDLHLALKPGSDVTLWNGLCRYLLDSDSWDKAMWRSMWRLRGRWRRRWTTRLATGQVARSCGLSRNDLLGYQLFARTPKTVTLFCQDQPVQPGVDKVTPSSTPT